MKTIDNCRIIRRGKWLGVGTPKTKDNDKCEGYCTERSDEPLQECQRCRYLKNWDKAQEQGA